MKAAFMPLRIHLESCGIVRFSVCSFQREQPKCNLHFEEFYHYI